MWLKNYASRNSEFSIRLMIIQKNIEDVFAVPVD